MRSGSQGEDVPSDYRFGSRTIRHLFCSRCGLKRSSVTKKDIADAHKTTEVLTCLSFDSKNEVNEIVDKAVAAGTSEAREPQDYGFMYGRSFNDLDGHIWEII